MKLHLERDVVPTSAGGGPWLLVQGLVDTLGASSSSESSWESCSSSEESSWLSWMGSTCSSDWLSSTGSGERGGVSSSKILDLRGRSRFLCRTLILPVPSSFPDPEDKRAAMAGLQYFIYLVLPSVLNLVFSFESKLLN